MPTKSTTTDCPKLSAKLRAVRELRRPDRPLKVEQIAEAFLCSDSTAYRILENQLDETVATLRHAIASGPADLADALVESLLSGTEYAMPRRSAEDRETDVNRDGRVDTADQLHSIIAILGRAQRALERAASTARPHLLEAEGAILATELAAVADAVETARAIVPEITLKRSAGLRPAG